MTTARISSGKYGNECVKTVVNREQVGRQNKQATTTQKHDKSMISVSPIYSPPHVNQIDLYSSEAKQSNDQSIVKDWRQFVNHDMDELRHKRCQSIEIIERLSNFSNGSTKSSNISGLNNILKQKSPKEEFQNQNIQTKFEVQKRDKDFKAVSETSGTQTYSDFSKVKIMNINQSVHNLQISKSQSASVKSIIQNPLNENLTKNLGSQQAKNALKSRFIDIQNIDESKDSNSVNLEEKKVTSNFNNLNQSCQSVQESKNNREKPTGAYHKQNRFQGFDFADFNEKNFDQQIKNSSNGDNNDSIDMDFKNSKICDEMYQSIYMNDFEGHKSKNHLAADCVSSNTPRYSISMEIRNKDDSSYIINMSEKRLQERHGSQKVLTAKQINEKYENQSTQSSDIFNNTAQYYNQKNVLSSFNPDKKVQSLPNLLINFSQFHEPCQNSEQDESDSSDDTFNVSNLGKKIANQKLKYSNINWERPAQNRQQVRKDVFGNEILKAVRNPLNLSYRNISENENYENKVVKSKHQVTFIDQLNNIKEQNQIIKKFQNQPLCREHFVLSFKEYNQLEWFQCPELQNELVNLDGKSTWKGMKYFQGLQKNDSSLDSSRQSSSNRSNEEKEKFKVASCCVDPSCTIF